VALKVITTALHNTHQQLSENVRKNLCAANITTCQQIEVLEKSIDITYVAIVIIFVIALLDAIEGTDSTARDFKEQVNRFISAR
jgi:hypothetical protein